MKKLVIWAVGVPLVVASMVAFSFESAGVQRVAAVTVHTAR